MIDPPAWTTLAPSELALLRAAAEARTRAFCPHSGFAVGCAIVDSSGGMWTGANVENASWNLGLCAERVAWFHALTHGATTIHGVAIVTEAIEPTTPCGACRQILIEFGADAFVLCATPTAVERHLVRALMPAAFDLESLQR